MSTMTPYHDGRLVVWGGDCLALMAAMAPDSVDAIVTDPPYGLGFMGKKWDDLPPGKEWAEACYRVLKPGGHLLAFGGTRTWHRLAVAIEDGGFEIRDSLAWLYGSGFPKSMNVAKAIASGTGRPEDIRRLSMGEDYAPSGRGRKNYDHGGASAMNGSTADVDVPDHAAEWEGWGTALKPAFEPIVVGRKPLGEKTVAANVLAHGTGALNIDACRIETTDKLSGGHGSAGQQMTDGWERPWMSDPDAVAANAARAREAQAKAEEMGRWPANVILDESQAEALDAQSGVLKSGANPAIRGSDTDKREVYGGFTGGRNEQPRRGTDIGGASRFFTTIENEEITCALPTEPAQTTPATGAPSASSAASTAERPAPLAGTSGAVPDDLPARFLYAAKAPKKERPVIVLPDGSKLAHPTVKPLAVMRWLVRLVTPPGGLVLDTFAGTGTTGEACVLEGFRCLLAEDPTKGEQDYLPLIDQRITRAIASLPKTEPMEQTA